MQLIKQAQRCIPNTLTTTNKTNKSILHCQQWPKNDILHKQLKQIKTRHSKDIKIHPTDLWISTNRGRFLISALSGAAQQFTAPYKKSLSVWCVPCRSTRLSFTNQATINQFSKHSRHVILHKTSISLNESLSWHINHFKNNTMQFMPLLSSYVC